MIDIKDISGNILLTTSINEGCKRKFTLMKEDYILLKFSLENPVFFKLGSYVECDFGLFEVCDLQKPAFNISTAGYDYELRIDSHYWKWKNKIFKFTPETGGQEASWNLTASLDAQVGIVLRNLKTLGYTYKEQDFVFSIDSTVENKAQLMTYENINILDALFSMAKKWDCECWVTENVIHFGRCEFGDSVPFEIGVNVGEMSRSESQSTYATRIYAFGSTRNIPANYRPTSEQIVVNGMVQKRLMLPSDTPYIDAYPNMTMEEAVEQIVVFDEVYPRRTGTMSDVSTKEYTDTTENEDGTATEQKWNAYRFKDTGITFSKDYVLPGEELKIQFQSGKLNGMTFAVTFDPDNKDEQLWEIVRNEDYGRPLPDDVLCPENGDTYVLHGWDSTKIAELGLVNVAEGELKRKAEDYVAKSKIDPNTYNCKMMSDSSYRENGVHNLYGVGQKVNLINNAYFKNGRLSRIIGFEFSLDYPYDSPTYTVGETIAYSRIGEIEEKLENLTIGGHIYVGGGGNSVYVIRKNDSTPATDSNVFSALRSLDIFLRKDRPDSTDYLTGFNSGITLGVGKKLLHDIIRSTDTSATPSETSVYSSLFVDMMISGLEDKYIRKDQPDSTLYQVDFTAGLLINSKRIGDVIRYYDDPKPVATDANIYSALQTDQRIEEEFGKIDDRYIRKDKVDVAHKHITFEEGITVEQLAKLMNLDVKQLATIAQAVCAVVRSSKFVDGFAGEGYQIWQDIASGDWCMTLDRLTVRKVLTIYELVVAKIRSVGGMIVVSAANGIIKSAERIGDQYVLEFDDVNQFVPGDLMRCQVFSPSGLKYYWVRVSAVNGEKVYVPASEFAGVEPVKGDEVVLMGNTDNPLRQNLLLISATEDGQPRFDCLDGVKSKSLEGCLKVRVGALDGISDSRFPADMQPSGYGIYGNNCFLTGIFVLSNGKDVMTMFSIMEGMIKSEISSVRNEINAKDNYLDNSAFADNMSGWSGTSNIRIFRVDGRLLYFNSNFYANKQAFAGITVNGTKSVLRLKNSSITQRNADFARHPEFDLYDITSTDEEGNEIVTGQQYRARMFYVSFHYKVTRPGTLRVYFKGENQEGFEEYAPINYTEVMNPTDEFRLMEIAGKWNGTGDFYLSFSGDMYLYSLALADNRLADVEEKFTMRFKATDKKIQANLDEIKKTGTKLEEYHSEFLLTARELRLQFTEDLSDAESRITAAYKSYVNLTARDLTVQFLEDLSDAESRITEAYTSAIELSARGLRADFTADLTDMEEGITSAYKSYVNLTAQNLQAGFSEDLADLRTGVTEAYTSAIELSARGLRAEFSSSITDINGKLTQHTSSFHVTSAKIEAMVSATDSISDTIRTAGWITTADGNKLWAAQTDLSKEADNARILAAVGNGKSLYDNPTFAEVSGNALKSRNNISVYNNAGGSAVSITRKSISGVPNDTGFGLEIATSASGGVTPGLGGFFFGTATKANRMMVCKFVAKVPAGYTVEFATNATGDGGVKKWLTAHVGTGNWEEYAYYVRCGSSGSFSSTFFFYLNGGSRPVTWQLASANVYELSVQDLASKYSQIKQTVDSISFEVYGEGGKFSILEQTVDTLSSFIGDGAEGDFSQIIQRINEIQLKVNKIILDDLGNVTNISTAGITTDESGNYLFATKTEFNNQGTQISTMQSELTVTVGKVEAIAARFDSEGNLIEGAGWLTTTNAASIYATKTTVNSLGERVTAAESRITANADSISMTVRKDGIISAINQTAESVTIDASKINLNGAVTVKALAADVKQVLDGKASSSGLGVMAYKDAVELAQLGESIIEGGYIKTSLINADLIVAKKLQTSTAKYNISLDNDGLVCDSYQNRQLFSLSAEYVSATAEGVLELGSILYADFYKVRISSQGIHFYKNGNLTKTYASE